jgi:hypothetical protein
VDARSELCERVDAEPGQQQKEKNSSSHGGGWAYYL